MGRRGKVALYKGIPGGKELGRIGGGGSDGFACKAIMLAISRRGKDSLDDGQGVTALCHGVPQQALGSAGAPRRNLSSRVD